MPVRFVGGSEDESGSEGHSKVQIKGKRGSPFREPLRGSTAQQSPGVKDASQFSRKPNKPAKSSTEKPKRKPTPWILALKEYNLGNSVYHIPKKGTKEYDHVRSLMQKHL